MNKLLIVAAIIGTIASSSAGYANDSNGYRSGDDYGTVVKIDRIGQMIELANGSSYYALFPDDLSDIKVGEKVRITFNDSDIISISR
ncbi:MAG: hypothetical protein ABJA10_06325 [Aestuariivirga sp.]